MEDTSNNNYNSQGNTNPGFVTGNPVAGQQGGVAISQQPFDIGQWLQSIGQQMNTPQQGGQSQGGMALPPAHQALVKGLTDGLQTTGKNLAATNPQAAASLLSSITGAAQNNPSSNANTPMGGGQIMSPLNLPASPNNQQQNTQQQQQSSQNQPQPVMNQKTGAPSDVNQMNDPLMNTVTNQANNVLTRKNSFLENVIPGLRGAHDTNQLGRLTMAAGIGDKRAAVDMQNMKNLGQEPIQPNEYMTAYSGMYQKTIDGLSQVATNAASGADTGLKLFTETSDNTRNAFQKMMAQPSDASSAALTNAVAQQKAQLAATMDFHDYIKNNPINKVMDNIKANLPKANNKDAQASAMAGRVGKYSFK